MGEPQQLNINGLAVTTEAKDIGTSSKAKTAAWIQGKAYTTASTKMYTNYNLVPN